MVALELTPASGTAVSWGSQVLLAVYYAALAVLALYGTHRLLLLAGWWRHRGRPLVTPPAPAEDAWPLVTVQLPLYNERFVAERLLRAVAALDYPADRLEVQVLDDSTDDTSTIVARVCEQLRRGGLDVRHLRRAERAGFKAGALAAGLAVARGDLLCIFDADFVPGRDFLRRLVPWFGADPGIGMVQARWGHLNRDDSLATRVQAMLLDGHFAVEHAARHRSGCFFNFNGTAGIWRRAAIEDAGGWQADTLTEDLDLSYRAQLAGWRFVFLPEVVVPAELPVAAADLEAQQHRWAKGAAQTARKLLPRLLTAPLPWRVRREAFVHLTANVSYPLLAVLAALIFPAMLLRRGEAWWQVLAVDLPLFALASGAVVLFYVASQVAVGEPWRARLRLLPALMATGIGLSVTNSAAVVAGAFVRGGTFHRTPKYRREDGAAPTEEATSAAFGTGGFAASPLSNVVSGASVFAVTVATSVALGATGVAPAAGDYAGARRLSFYVEGVLALYFAACFAAAVALGMWASLPFLYLFLQGYGYLFLLALLGPRLSCMPAAPRSRPARRSPSTRATCSQTTPLATDP
ncbi:MAG TPA: glycosyltransferase [Thermoanaerobaculia bacterium]|nr:glycosyltransferase [Thermoanaerobaculia bacterium]